MPTVSMRIILDGIHQPKYIFFGEKRSKHQQNFHVKVQLLDMAVHGLTGKCDVTQLQLTHRIRPG